MRRRGVAGEIQRYREDPVAFCQQVLRFEPWSKQREIAESVRDNFGRQRGRATVSARRRSLRGLRSGF